MSGYRCKTYFIGSIYLITKEMSEIVDKTANDIAKIERHLAWTESTVDGQEQDTRFGIEEFSDVVDEEDLAIARKLKGLIDEANAVAEECDRVFEWDY